VKRIILAVVVGATVAACGDREMARDSDPEVVPVEMDTLTWFREGHTVEHAGLRWVMVGPPVYEPLALTRVGDFQGTPLYAERGVASPPRRIYIPVGGGYWQMLEQGQAVAPADTATDMGPVPGPEGDEMPPAPEGVEP
jgi:hypothetical protein